jgi:hypothetical protein
MLILAYCLFTGFVFLALLEFTVVNYLWRKENHKDYRRGGRMNGRDYNFQYNDGQREAAGYDRSPPAGNTLIHVRINFIYN